MRCRYKYCDEETFSEYIHYCSIECNQKATGYIIPIIESEEENEQEEITA